MSSVYQFQLLERIYEDMANPFLSLSGQKWMVDLVRDRYPGAKIKRGDFIGAQEFVFAELVKCRLRTLVDE